MSVKPILIHFHFHKRKTGVTSSIESVLPYFEKDFETYIFGNLIEWKRISWLSIMKLALSKNHFIIHAHRNNEILRALFLRRLGGKFTLVATRHAESKPSRMTRYLLSKVDEVVTLTQSMKEHLPLKSTLISHGVNTHRFEPKSKVKLQRVTQENIISVAGRIREKKGHEVFFNAITPLLKNYPEWAIVVVGKIDNVEFYEKLMSIVKKAGVGSQVYFFSESKNIQEFYQASKITVVPSFSEGFSLVCLEAMACGSTVIATQGVGVHGDVIESGETGYLFPPGDTNKLQEIIFEILSGKKKLIDRKGRQQIINFWSAEKEANLLTELYKKRIKPS